MNKLSNALIVSSIATLLLVSCSLHKVQAQSEADPGPRAISYKVLLGKSMTDPQVSDFISSNNCSSTAQTQLCKYAGIALWISPDQRVETVYLYLNNADGIDAYRGELPFGLKFYDIMEAVEYKLKRQGVGNAGMPDEGRAPDHLHFQAIYKQAGMTIIYNSPSPEDEDATIYAILLNQ